MIEIEYIQAKVESVGATVVMLPAQGTRPNGYRSCWPDFERDFADHIGAPKQNTKPRHRPTMRQMNEFEEVEDWILDLGEYARIKKMPWIARAVAYGMLHWPDSGKRCYGWSKLGRKLGVSHTTAKRWYIQGIEIIHRQRCEVEIANSGGGGRESRENVFWIPKEI